MRAKSVRYLIAVVGLVAITSLSLPTSKLLAQTGSTCGSLPHTECLKCCAGNYNACLDAAKSAHDTCLAGCSNGATCAKDCADSYRVAKDSCIDERIQCSASCPRGDANR